MKKLLILMMLFSAYASSAQNFCNMYANKSEPIVIDGQTNVSISNLRIQNQNPNPNDPNKSCIIIRNCTNVSITNCMLGPAKHNGILIENSTNVLISQCSFEKFSTGVLAVGGSSNIKVKDNKFINPDAYLDIVDFKPDGTSITHSNGNHIFFNNVMGLENEISNNVFECIKGNCAAEDLINAFQSHHVLIKNNKLRGGAGRNKFADTEDSSGGIMCGDDGGTYITAENNTLVDPGQYGIAIACGTNHTIKNNTIYAKQQSFTNVGIYVWDQYPDTCYNHLIEGNKVNWIANYGGQNPFWNAGNCPNTVTLNNQFPDLTLTENILPERLICPDMMAGYGFNGDLLDASGGMLHGTGQGRIGYDVCKKSLKFDGINDLVVLPRSPWFRPSLDKITVETWIKPEDFSKVMAIAHSQDGDGWNHGWRIIVDHGILNARMVTNNGINDLTADITTTGLLQNQWNHVVLTYSGKNLKLYINGVLKTTYPITGNIKYNGETNMRLGYSDGQNYFFKGLMGTFKFYRAELTDSEVLDEYNTFKSEYDNYDVPTTTTFSITGTSSVQAGQINNYSIPEVLGATNYNWTIIPLDENNDPINPYNCTTYPCWEVVSTTGSSCAVSIGSLNAKIKVDVLGDCIVGSGEMLLVQNGPCDPCIGGKSQAEIIYTNPIEDYLFYEIKTDDKSKNSNLSHQLKIYNNQGKLKKTVAGISTNKQEIFVGDMEAGLYFMKIEHPIYGLIEKKIVIN